MYKQNTGFTLIEIMIAVAIVSILAAIAYPSYMTEVSKGKRLEAQSLLMEMASREQRFFSNQLRFTNDLTALGYSSPLLTESGAYQISIATNVANSTFTLTATAQPGQSNDGCGNLTLTDTGARGKSGSTPLSQCWR